MLSVVSAYAGGDIRFAIGVNDSITQNTASSGSNSNKFVIDKDGNVGIGTNLLKSKLDIGFAGQTGSLLRLGTDRLIRYV